MTEGNLKNLIDVAYEQVKRHMKASGVKTKGNNILDESARFLYSRAHYGLLSIAKGNSVGAMKVPYTQQFSPKQTPLRKLLPILREQAKASKSNQLRAAIASAFHKDSKDPDGLAGNTLIALKYYGIINRNDTLTDFGKQLVACQGNEAEAHKLLAGRILFEFGGVALVETLKEMKAASLEN